MKRFWKPLLFCTALLAASCGGDDGTGPATPTPAQLNKVSGDGQTGTVARALGAALVASVAAANGSPLSGVTVT
ncbi:MAG: hypothetical protein HY703_06230, partial [Gemmatimonadetes bacterium]|nr:hypothetical protein [Gemmatimonadota bacterium]